MTASQSLYHKKLSLQAIRHETAQYFSINDRHGENGANLSLIGLKSKKAALHLQSGFCFKIEH